MWDQYKDRELACFLCDQPVDRSTPICTQVLPEYDDGRGGGDNKLIGAPLCESCRDLAPAVRWSRSLKVLQMFSANTGKNIRFRFNNNSRRHNPR
jgi:hypothetical protein